MQAKSRWNARITIVGAVLACACAFPAVFALFDAASASAAPLLAMPVPASGATTGATPTFSGSTSDSVDPVTIRVYKGSSVAGSPVQILTAAPSEGGWSAPATGPLVNGTYTAVAEQTESIEEEPFSETGKTEPVTFTVYEEAPKVTLSPVARSKVTTPSFGGTSNASTPVVVRVYEGTKPSGTKVAEVTVTNPEGSWTSGTVSLKSGEHTYTAVATQESPIEGDPAGESEPQTFEVDTEPPKVTLSEVASPTNDRTPSFSGTASEDTEVAVHVFLGETEVATATTTASDGTWSTSAGELSKELPKGKNTFTVSATEESGIGNKSRTTAPRTFEVDTESPVVTIKQPASPTNKREPSFSGTASEDTAVTVRVLEGATEVASATTTASGGTWSTSTLSKPLPAGRHSFEVYATEASSLKNPEGVSKEKWTLEVDTLAPTVTIKRPTSPSRETRPSFSGSASEDTAVTVYVFEGTKEVAKATTTASAGSWSTTGASLSSELPAGKHKFTAYAIEASGLGNESDTSETVEFEVDTEAPKVTLVGPPSPAKNTSPSFSGTASEAGEVVVHVLEEGGPLETASGTVNGEGKWSATVGSPLPEGKHKFTAYATEVSGLGNKEGQSETAEFEVDTLAPKVTIEQPPARSKSRSPSFSGTASEAGKVVVHVLEEGSPLETASGTVNGEGKWSATVGSPLPEGRHTFSVYATETSAAGAGEGHSEERTFEVDTQPPEVTIEQPKTPSKNTKPSFAGTASEAQEVVVHVFEGSTEVASAKTTASGGKWSTEPLSSALKSGKHTFTAYATEKSGLENGTGESAKVTFEVDTESPTVTIEQPKTPSKNTKPSFAGTASEAQEVVVHVFEGSTEVASATTTASGGKWSTSGGSLSKALPEGKHTFTAYATEKSGLENEKGESAKVTFEVDTESPTVTIEQPKTPSKNTKPSFSGTASEAGEVVVHVLEAGSPVETASATVKDGKWSATLGTALSEGKHTFTAYASEKSGLENEEGKSSTVGFEVNTEPPVVTLKALPSPTNKTKPTFSGTASEETEVVVHITYKEGSKEEEIKVSVDATGGTWSVGATLPSGKHVFKAYATEKSKLENESGKSGTVEFEVATEPPSVTLNALARSRNVEPSFSGTASETGPAVTVDVYEGAKAEGTVVATATAGGERAGTSWTAGAVSTPLPAGNHTFTAVAVEASGLGNEAGKSAPMTFEVDTHSPEVTIEQPPSPSSNTKPAFKGTASEAGEVVVHVFEGSTEVASAKATASGGKWATSALSEALPGGERTFTAYATEKSAIGNEAGTSPPVVFAVDTKPPAVTLEPVARSKDRTPVFKGMASEKGPAVTVEIYEGTTTEGMPISTATAAGARSGESWTSGDAGPALPEGKHTFTAIAIEQSGIEAGEGTSAPVTFEVDTLAPEVTIGQPSSPSNKTEPTFSGTASEAGQVVVHILEGAKQVATGSAEVKEGKWSTTSLSGELAKGKHAFTAYATETGVLKNAEGESTKVTFEVNTEAPTVTLNAVARSKTTTPSFSGTASESGPAVTVEIYAGSKAEGTPVANATATGGRSGTSWTSGNAGPALKPVGNQVYTAVAAEPSGLGNKEGKSAEVHFEVDTEAPEVKLNAIARSNKTTPSFSGTASEGEPAVTVEIYAGSKVEGTPVASATATGGRSGTSWTSGSASPALKPSGNETFTAVAIEPSGIGNAEGKSGEVHFEVDTEPPEVKLNQVVRSDHTTPLFSGMASEGEPAVTVEIYAGSKAEGTPVSSATAAGGRSGTSWTSGNASPALKPVGNQTYTAVAVEASGIGNKEGKSTEAHFEVDTSPPVVTIAKPESPSNHTDPAFSGEASENTEVEVHVLLGTEAVATATTTASGGKWSIAAGSLSKELPKGKNTFTAYATEKSELSGNEKGESARVTFEVNTEAPKVTLNAVARSKTTTPSFTGTASETGPAVTVEIYAGSKVEGTPVASATAAGSRSAEGWTSGNASPALKPVGNQTYTAVAVESSGLGNEAGKSGEVHFEVDTEPPTVTLNAVARSKTTTPSFSGTASEAGPAVTVEIYAGSKVEGTPVASATAAGSRSAESWTSGSASPALKPVGNQTYTAVAVETSGIGNAEGKSGEVHFEVDTEPPEVKLNQVVRSNHTTPLFSGTASEAEPAVTVEIYAGSKAEGTPVSSATATGGRSGTSWTSGNASPALKPVGNQTYTAVAVEASGIGNKEGKSEEVHFEVDTEPPVVTLHALETPSNNTKPVFLGTASEETEVVVHVIYEEGSKEKATEASIEAKGGSWSVQVSLPGFANPGKHRFKAYAIEKSGIIGNLEGKSEERTFEVDTEPPVVTMESLPAISPESKPDFSGTANEAGEVTVDVFRGNKAEGTPVRAINAVVSSEKKWLTPHLPEALPEGPYVAVASEPSALKNAPGESAEIKFEVDTKAPFVTIEHVASPSKDKEPLFAGEASNHPGKDVIVHVYKGATQVWQEEVPVQNGKWTSKQISPPLEGGYNTYWVQTTAKSELSGAEGKSEERTFVIDTNPPAVTLSPLPALSKEATPSFSGTTNESGSEAKPVAVSIYHGPKAEGSAVAEVAVTAVDGAWASKLIQALQDGEYTAVAMQESAIGNGPGKSKPVTFTIDTKPPTVTLEALPTKQSGNRRPSFSGTASEEPGPVTLKIYSGGTSGGIPTGSLVRSIKIEVLQGEWHSGKLEESERLEWGEYTAVATEPSSLGNPEGISAPFTFEVAQIAPTALTERAEVTERTATLYASVDPLGGSITACDIEVGRTTAYERKIGCGFPSGATSFPEDATGYVPVFIRIYGLSPTTTYHYRVAATGEGGTGAGADQTFTTLAEEGFGSSEQGATASSSSSGQAKGGVAAFFARQLAPTGKSATIPTLLKNGTYKLKLAAPGAGTAVVKWYYLPPGAKLALAKDARSGRAGQAQAKGKPQSVLVASGKLTFHAAGSATVKLALTSAGRRLLERSQRLKLTATCAFTPAGGSAIATSQTFALKR